jgi:transposase-like protein
MSKAARKNWSDEEQAAWARKILNGETTIEAVRKELETQSYQVSAWVGLEAEKLAQQGLRFQKPGEISAVLPRDVSEKEIESMSSEDKMILNLLTKKFLKQLAS